MTRLRNYGGWMATAVAVAVTAGGGLVAARANVRLTQQTAGRISVADFAPLQACGGALVVDVRDEHAYKDGHIPGAMNVPMDQMEAKAVLVRDKAGERPIVTYCSCPNEHTSAIAASMLRESGASKVSALVGGFPAWVQAGGAVER